MISYLPYGGALLFVILNTAWLYVGIWGPGMVVPPSEEFVGRLSDLIFALWTGGAIGGAAWVTVSKQS